MGQKICTGSTSWERCWFYMERGLNVRLCSLVYQRCSRSSTKYFLCPTRRSTGAAVSTATKHKVCFGVWVRPLSQRLPSHTHAAQAFCLESAPHCPALLFFFIVPVGQGEQIPMWLFFTVGQSEEIRSRLQCDTQLVSEARPVVIRLSWLHLIHISSRSFKITSWWLSGSDAAFLPPQTNAASNDIIRSSVWSWPQSQQTEATSLPAFFFFCEILFGFQLVTWYSFYHSGGETERSSVFLGWTGHGVQFVHWVGLKWVRGVIEVTDSNPSCWMLSQGLV